jgi:endo-1,4-beta-xylanase
LLEGENTNESGEIEMINVIGKRICAGMCFVLSVIVFFALPAAAQSNILLQNDFEKGVDKWEPRGQGVSIASSKDQAAGGMKSLRVSGRSANWQGAQLNITKLVAAGTAYKFSLSVKLAKGHQPDDIKMTMQRGDNQFVELGFATVTPDAWAAISGRFKPTGRDPYLLLYVEALRPNTSYFIDDFKIELADDLPAQKGAILQNDFEDRTAQDWNVRGDGVQMFSSNAFGANSIKVSGRSQPSHGLALDVSPLLFKGRVYQISVSARLVRGQSPDSVKITMQQTAPGGKVTNIPITESTKVTDAEWTTLSGSYKATTNDNNLLICVEAAGASTAFHIDNFLIRIPD